MEPSKSYQRTLQFDQPSDDMGRFSSPIEACSYAVEVLARTYAEWPLREEPKLAWKALRVTAGKAYPTRNQIVLSTCLVFNEYRVERVLRHEYAHLLAHARHGHHIAPHGVEWRLAMLDLGEEPLVRHRFEVRRNQRRTVAVYRCQKCGERIVVARRFPRNRRYLHINCNGRLAFEGIETNPTS